jgi:carbonic anhydrase
MASKVQMLDLDSIEGSAPSMRPRHQHKRRRTDDEPHHKRNEPVPNAEFESQLAATQQKYTRVVGDADSAVTAKVCSNHCFNCGPGGEIQT